MEKSKPCGGEEGGGGFVVGERVGSLTLEMDGLEVGEGVLETTVGGVGAVLLVGEQPGVVAFFGVEEGEGFAGGEGGGGVEWRVRGEGRVFVHRVGSKMCKIQKDCAACG